MRLTVSRTHLIVAAGILTRHVLTALVFVNEHLTLWATLEAAHHQLHTGLFSLRRQNVFPRAESAGSTVRHAHGVMH